MWIVLIEMSLILVSCLELIDPFAPLVALLEPTIILFPILINDLPLSIYLPIQVLALIITTIFILNKNSHIIIKYIVFETTFDKYPIRPLFLTYSMLQPILEFPLEY